MIYKIDKVHFKGGGPISVLYPGTAISKNDTGIGSLGRIDHALFAGNHTVPMHPHINDEILSYFRTGKAEHTDSEGNVEFIGGKKLMLMKAGKYFQHEERIIAEADPLEGLQIFIRPGKKDLTPQVIFFDLPDLHSLDKWRLLASPTKEAVFQFSSQTWLYDTKISENKVLELPELPRANLTSLLYIFQGEVVINNAIHLDKKESIIIKDESISIKASVDSELVLFVTDEKAEIFKQGMFSGNMI